METFRLDDDCLGVIWRDVAGWLGCLRWDELGDTDQIGPVTSVTAARLAVREQFVSWMLASGERDCAADPLR